MSCVCVSQLQGGFPLPVPFCCSMEDGLSLPSDDEGMSLVELCGAKRPRLSMPSQVQPARSGHGQVVSLLDDDEELDGDKEHERVALGSQCCSKLCLSNVLGQATLATEGALAEGKRGSACRGNVRESKMRRERLQNMSRLDRRALEISIVKESSKPPVQVSVESRCPPSSTETWTFHVLPVYQKAFKSLTGVTDYALYDARRQLRMGAVRPKDDERRLRRLRAHEVHPNSFFEWVYRNVAEDLTELRDVEALDIVDIPFDVDFDDDDDVGEPAPFKDIRYIDHTTQAEFYDQYESFYGKDCDALASISTFRHTFKKQGWVGILRMRGVSQQARCAECAESKHELRQCVEEVKRVQLRCDYEAHLTSILADRSVGHSLSSLSERSAHGQCSAGGSTLLLMIDGMDEANFQIPRNLASSHLFDARNRPQLHVIGVVVPGLLEGYFFAEGDVKTDSNMNLTVIARSLDLCKEILTGRGLAMPLHLAVMADNTTRDQRNQFAMIGVGKLAHDQFESTACTFYKKGHTQNDCHKGFNDVAEILSAARTLETIDDFMALLAEKMVPRRGRQLHVEKIDATYDWKSYLMWLNVSMKGLAKTADCRDVVHSFRFVKRRDLELYQQKCVWDVNVDESPFPARDTHHADIILLMKHRMSSRHLCQAPLLCIPHEMFALLHPDGPTEVEPRKVLADTVLREYRNTAQVVEQHPWNLSRAASYLREYCEKNELELAQLKMAVPPAEPLRTPPTLTFVSTFRDVWADVDAAINEDAYQFAPEPPKQVQVEPHVKCVAIGVGVWGRRGPGGVGCSKCRNARRGCGPCRPAPLPMDAAGQRDP